MFEVTTVHETKISKKAKLYTLEEYLEMEENSEINHEYYNGKLIPLPGGTPNHSEIKGLVITSLNMANRKAEKPFKVYNSDIRIYLPELGRSVMPDGAVVVGQPEFTFEKPVGLLANPTLVVEVFSKSSEAYDRGDKFKRYRTLPSFTEYMLVSQEKPMVETFVKKDGKWFIHETTESLEAVVYLESLGISISLSDIYWGVVFAEKKETKKAETKKEKI